MDKKVEAARHAKGVITLQPKSAEQVRQAVQQVSTITEQSGQNITFEGTRIIEGHGFGRHVNCYDIYDCPKGYLLHTYMNTGPNWAVTGKTLKDMLAQAPDQSVAKRAHGELVKKNMISIHAH